MRATTADDYWLGKGRQAACAALTGLALRATSQRGSTTAAAGQANGTLAAGCYRRHCATAVAAARAHMQRHAAMHVRCIAGGRL
jgi:hypothetical protein